MKKWDLPKGWEWKKLGDVASISDRNHTTPLYKKTGYPLISPTMFTEYGIELENAKFVENNELIDFKKKCDPAKGDLLYSRIGSVGKARIIDFDNDFVALHSIAVIKPKKSIVNNRFLYYFLNSTYGLRQANAGVRSISVPDLGLEKIEKFSIPTPPLETQQKIVAILDKAEEIKRLRAEANAQTKKLIQSVFLDMFGDQQHNPKKWKMVPIGSVAKKIQYGYTESAKPENVGPKFLRITDIQNGLVSWDDVPFCNISETEINKFRLSEGDIVFARTGATVGKSYIIGSDIPLAVFASYLIRLVPSSQVDSRFIYEFFQTDYYWSQIKKGSSGSTQPSFNAEKLSKILIPLPDIELQKRFSMIAKKIDKLSCSDYIYDNGYQSLVNKVFKGELVA